MSKKVLTMAEENYNRAKKGWFAK